MAVCISPVLTASRTCCPKYADASQGCELANVSFDFSAGTCRRKHALFASTAIAALLLLPSPLWAGPNGGTVVDGAATISQAGPATNINQSTNKASSTGRASLSVRTRA
ncbi:hypothetical protein OCA5_pHCG301140 (plasmid) [Afipia carboxidovorans OM5]|uniref:Uncharacterized protein n=1 Tax=Afipia carboxidovorans (strain ATCC 49405 / DSM 1227 / KCTC 32145 / OM5) TaxID=504832 RepID=F8C175_AFIC5|nr:hypothetical protein OCA4_pHCG3B01130 [Afipia carboxidovorans OM4]AEI08185.1 hypothetical protein OCA5_pHCG301140 [Afipia carboxidovorans OM5]